MRVIFLLLAILLVFGNSCSVSPERKKEIKNRVKEKVKERVREKLKERYSGEQ